MLYTARGGAFTRWVYFAHSDDRIELILENASPTQRAAVDALLPVRQVLDSGSAEMFSEIPGGMESGETEEIGGVPIPRSAMVLPLCVGERMRGAIALI